MHRGSAGSAASPGSRSRPKVTLLAHLVSVSERVAATPARLSKVRELADFLRSLPPDEIEHRRSLFIGRDSAGTDRHRLRLAEGRCRCRRHRHRREHRDIDPRGSRPDARLHRLHPRPRFGGSPASGARRFIRPSHRARAALLDPAAGRGAASRCAGRRHARCHRRCRAAASRRGEARRHVRRELGPQSPPRRLRAAARRSADFSSKCSRRSRPCSRRPPPTWARRCASSAARRRSSGKWTAHASRCTRPAARSASTPAD